VDLSRTQPCGYELVADAIRNAINDAVSELSFYKMKGGTLRAVYGPDDITHIAFVVVVSMHDGELKKITVATADDEPAQVVQHAMSPAEGGQ
jgi:hypothetical protein